MSRLRSAVITFPGSNCDRDLAVAMEDVFERPVLRVWHQETELPKLDLIGVPGGFSPTEGSTSLASFRLMSPRTCGAPEGPESCTFAARMPESKSSGNVPAETI